MFVFKKDQYNKVKKTIALFLKMLINKRKKELKQFLKLYIICNYFKMNFIAVIKSIYYKNL